MCLPERQAVILRAAEPHDRATLRPDQVVRGDADGPAEPRRLRHHLVQRVHRLRPADPGDRFHVGAPLEELHAERDRAQLQQALELRSELANRFRHDLASLPLRPWPRQVAQHSLARSLVQPASSSLLRGAIAEE